MTRGQSGQVIVIGAGAAGLMAARELGRAGKRVTILEARDRCGGRIHPLARSEFGYGAEAGAEFVHGEAPVTRALLREAGLSLLTVQGQRWNVAQGTFSRDEEPDPEIERFYQVVADLKADLTVADFLQQHFAAPKYNRLRRFVVRMVEGYDAADPARASMLALRDEWMHSGRSKQARIVGGYGALIDFLSSACRSQGVGIHFGAVVGAIETGDDGVLVRCVNGETYRGDAVVITLPLPLLQEIGLPEAARAKAAIAADIGFGNVIKVLVRFKTRWWIDAGGKDLSDLLFLLSDQAVPVWWTQHPAEHAVLTGWLSGPATARVARLDERALIETGITSLAGIFALSPERLRRDVVAARAINWGNDPYARGAYSYATVKSHAAQDALAGAEGGILFSGEALYQGPDMGTVEAALASGLEASRYALRSR